MTTNQTWHHRTERRVEVAKAALQAEDAGGAMYCGYFSSPSTGTSRQFQDIPNNPETPLKPA